MGGLMEGSSGQEVIQLQRNLTLPQRDMNSVSDFQNAAHARETETDHSSEPLEVFISHSSKDKAIAFALIELLRSSLNIPAERIRCTSVDGNRLPIAALVNARLRQEVFDAETFITIITQESLLSTYVLFEMGARWGAGRPLAPILAAGMTTDKLKAPLASFNSLNCENSLQVFQLVSDIGKILKRSPAPPQTYKIYVDNLVAISHAGNYPEPSVMKAVRLDRPNILCGRTTDYDLKEFREEAGILIKTFGGDQVTVEDQLTADKLKKVMAPPNKFNILQFSGEINKTGTIFLSGGSRIPSGEFLDLIRSAGIKLVVFPFDNALYLAARVARNTNVIVSCGDNEQYTFLAWERNFYACLSNGEKVSTAFESAIQAADLRMTLFLKEDFCFRIS